MFCRDEVTPKKKKKKKKSIEEITEESTSTKKKKRKRLREDAEVIQTPTGESQAIETPSKPKKIKKEL